MKPIEFLYLSFLLIALLLIYFAIKDYNATQNLIKTGRQTKAKVINLLTSRDSDGDTMYRPVFEYTDKKNNVITFESKVSSRPASYDIGEEVKIVYSANNEEQKIVSFWGLYRWTIVLLVFAFPLLIIGGGYMLFKYQ